MEREKFKWKNHKNLSTDAAHRGGLVRISYEAAEKQWSKGTELSGFIV
jgi:hypothetical protein